jgi:hypothetical protein
MTHPDFDDSIADLIGAPMRNLPKPLPQDFVPALDRVFEEPCAKCRGSGQWISFSGRIGGQCFACKGLGKFTFKTSPEHRAAGRIQAAKRKGDAMADFVKANETEMKWLAAAAERQHKRAHKVGTSWNFPIELMEKFAQYGSLTEGQLGAVRKCMARDEVRRAEAEKAKDERPAVDGSKIAAAFERAQRAAQADGEGIMDLRLRLDTFVFSLSRDHDGSIWIKDKTENTWVGKIAEGKFQRYRSCTDDQQTRVLAACADPATAARAFGQRFTQCSCCGRTLTNAKSREMGIGPICAGKWGF